MKTATFYAVIAIVASFGLTAFGKAACNGNGNGGGQPGVGPVDEFPPMDQFPEILPPPLPTGLTGAPTAPQVRITPLNPTPQNAPATQSSAPSARVSLVPDKPIATDVAEETPTTNLEDSLDPALAGLVGTWSTPSRYGDGELTTVEIQFDDRGWAKLTVPAADGKPSTIKRRVSLENKELKLRGPDEETQSLGKLIEFDSRQMVLERAGRQFTYVRRAT